jgi:membrane protease YdiL (CAAX protease family)
MVIGGISLLIMGVGLLALNYAGEFSLPGLLGAGLNALFFIISLIACLFTFLLLFARLFIGRNPTQPQIFDEVNWGGTPMLVIVIAYFVISVMVTLLSSTAGAYAGSLAFITLPLYLVVRTYRRSTGTMGFRTPRVKWFLILLPVIPVLLLLNELVYEMTERILGQFPLDEILKEIITENPLLMGINTGVVAPIGEEVFFRGFVYTGLRRKYGVRNGILLSSLFFGLTHGIPWQIPYAFAAGVILAAVYEKTGSLYSPILIHIINNSLAVIGIIS